MPAVAAPAEPPVPAVEPPVGCEPPVPAVDPPVPAEPPVPALTRRCRSCRPSAAGAALARARAAAESLQPSAALIAAASVRPTSFAPALIVFVWCAFI